MLRFLYDWFIFMCCRYHKSLAAISLLDFGPIANGPCYNSAVNARVLPGYRYLEKPLPLPCTHDSTPGIPDESNTIAQISKAKTHCLLSNWRRYPPLNTNHPSEIGPLLIPRHSGLRAVPLQLRRDALCALHDAQQVPAGQPGKLLGVPAALVQLGDLSQRVRPTAQRAPQFATYQVGVFRDVLKADWRVSDAVVVAPQSDAVPPS